MTRTMPADIAELLRLRADASYGADLGCALHDLADTLDDEPQVEVVGTHYLGTHHPGDSEPVRLNTAQQAVDWYADHVLTHPCIGLIRVETHTTVIKKGS